MVLGVALAFEDASGAHGPILIEFLELLFALAGHNSV